MIVEAQPVDYLVHRFPTRCKALAKDACTLERSPQAFGRRIVPAISLAAHRTAHAVAFEQVLEVTTAILGEFNRSSQQSLMQAMIGVRAAFRQEFSN